MKVVYNILFLLSTQVCTAQITAQKNYAMMEEIFGAWEAVEQREAVVKYKKIMTVEPDKHKSYFSINSDGTCILYYQAIDILGNSRSLAAKAKWTYNAGNSVFKTDLQVGHLLDEARIVELTDSTMIMVLPQVMDADEILPFNKFEKITSFVRYYGDRKTFGNRWNQNPHFTFSSGDLYLIPYDENPLIEKTHPFAYSGFYFKSDKLSFSLDYIDSQSVFIRDFKKNENLIRNVILQMNKVTDLYTEMCLEEKYLMKNEGVFQLYESDNKKRSETIRVKMSVCDAMFKSMMNSDKTIEIKEGMNNLNIRLKSSSGILEKIEKSENSYILHFLLNDIPYYLPLNFFDRQGILENVSEQLVFKVLLKNDSNNSILPESYYYKLEFIYSNSDKKMLQ